MNSITRIWLTWRYGRRFARLGKGCNFGRFLEVDGHVEAGDYCHFRKHVTLRAHGEGKITFGDRSGASYFCIIEAAKLVQIGARTGIAEFTVIRDSHHMVHGTDINWRMTPLLAKPIIIGEDVLIGSRCYIMPGVTIGDGAVIEAGSIVTKNVGAYEIWAGMPARFIAHRTKNVPPTRLKQFQDLIERYGIKEDRYGYPARPEGAAGAETAPGEKDPDA